MVLDPLAQIDAITKTANPETCVTCHTGDDPVVRSGANHQEIYKEFYQDGVVKVSEMAFTTSGGNTAVLTFKMTKNGAPFDCTKSTAATSDFSIGSYWAEYDVATKTGGPLLGELLPTQLASSLSTATRGGTNGGGLIA